MSKVLGIDYGSSKVGLALADLETKVAVPLEAVEPNQLNDKISELIESEGLEKIVVGLPLNMAGKESNQTKEVKSFIAKLKAKLNIDIDVEDERLSTAQAQKSGKDDAVAAMYILQSYVDRIYG